MQSHIMLLLSQKPPLVVLVSRWVVARACA